jgi:protein transport protein SEC24
VQFVDDGRRWKCNMCFIVNDGKLMAVHAMCSFLSLFLLVPHFFDYSAGEQRMVNRWERAELNHAVVEYIAPAEYMVRPPQPPVFLFVIDVSYAAIQSGK